MKQSKILVIAFKYNDILYALGTSEFKAATFKKLVIFYIDGRNPKDFPLQDAFNEVKYIRYREGFSNLWRNLLKIRSLHWDCDVLTFSNPLLLATKYIAKLSHSKTIIWLEDGLMNYYPLSDIPGLSHRKIKHTVQDVLRINDEQIFANKELITYLLCPEMAVSFWGEKKALSFDKNLLSRELYEKLTFLEGKKIFIGQALYATDGINKDYYVETVNRVIKEYGIDYYVPHYGSKDEDIKCEFLNLQDYHITFEFLASAISFTLFSVSSTLLYSTKKINSLVKTFMVNLNGVDNNKPILRNTIDGIV